MINKLDKELNFHHQALSLRAARQELLSSNVANADTPNFAEVCGLKSQAFSSRAMYNKPEPRTSRLSTVGRCPMLLLPSPCSEVLPKKLLAVLLFGFWALK
jgi:hypothetical protein